MKQFKICSQLPAIVLFISGVFLLYWYRIYFSAEPIAAVDLPGHILAIEQLMRQWWHGRIVFYDPQTFTGWPAFQFYGFLAHLITAILATLLSLWTLEPARLAAHLVLLLTVAAVPGLIYYAALPFAADLCRSNLSAFHKHRWVVALSAAAFGFWFLNHDHQWHGIGAAAIMNIGLFSQSFGWIFLLLHQGALVRLLIAPSRTTSALVAIFFAGLILSHNLTLAYASFIAAISWCWFRRARRRIFFAHAIGIGITGFWLVPMIGFSKYIPFDLYLPEGDFLELLFRYPTFGLFRGLKAFINGGAITIDPANILAMGLVCVLLIHPAIRRSRVVLPFAIFQLLAILLFSSKYIGISLPLGFHYYRFAAYIFLSFVVLFSAVPIVFVVRLKEGSRVISAALVGMLGVIVFMSQVFLPHNERERIRSNSTISHLANEQKVLDYFKTQPEKARVIFGYFNDYQKYPFLSAHYMVTRLKKETGFEPVNGLLLQSSLAYLFPIGSLGGMGVSTWASSQVYLETAKLSDEARVKQLKEFGVNYVVVGADKDIARLKPFANEEPVKIGPYTIIKICDAPFAPAMPVKKRVVGYVDGAHTLPFKFLEYYFWAHESLFSHFELVEISDGITPPEQLDAIIVNMGNKPSEKLTDLFPGLSIPLPAWTSHVTTLNYSYRYPLRHYDVWYQYNYEYDDYKDIEKYLDGLNLMQSLPSSAQAEATSSTAGNVPAFDWDPYYQDFTVRNIVPNAIYRLNYSYFPLWKSHDSLLLRGLGERMFLVPRGTTAKGHFLSLTAPLQLLGWAVTVSALAALFLLQKFGKR